MGCGCASHCGKSTEELTEFNNSDNLRVKINDIFSNDQKLLGSLVKLQSLYRGIKAREKFKKNDKQIDQQNEVNEEQNAQLNEKNDEQNGQQNEHQNDLRNITSHSNHSIIIKEDELTTLLNSYQPLNDNVQVEIKSPIEYPNENTKYYGEWDIAKNVRHGRGILAWSEGSKYIGYWVNDRANIRGKLIHNDGDIYDGEWIDDKPNGKGTYIHKDGTIYEGEWKNDKQEGKGKEKWVDGTSSGVSSGTSSFLGSFSSSLSSASLKPSSSKPTLISSSLFFFLLFSSASTKSSSS